MGLYPDTISSDLTAGGQTFHSLLECMAKFMSIGYSLADVITAATTRSPRFNSSRATTTTGCGAPACARGRRRSPGRVGQSGR